MGGVRRATSTSTAARASWRRRSSPTPTTCNSNLIGTGPFKLDHWTVNQELVVNKNPDYWQKDSKGNQLPYLDKITFKPIAEASQRVASLEGGQLDVMHTSDGQQVDALDQMASQFNLMKEKPGRRETRYYLMNVAKAPLDDIDARMAIATAIDRDQINQIRNNGVYDISNGPFDFKVPGYVKNPGFPKFNLKKATALAKKYKDAHGGRVQRGARAHQRPGEHRRGRPDQAAALQGRDRRDDEAGRPDRLHHRRGHRELQHHAVAPAPRATTPTGSTCGGTPVRS